MSTTTCIVLSILSAIVFTVAHFINSGVGY